MTRLRYDPVTQLLHWVVAALVIACFAIGIWREELPRDEFRAWLLRLHMALGLTVIGLTFVRIAWRSVVAAPPPVSPSPLMRRFAKLGHLALYLGLVAVTAGGLFAAWAKTRDVSLFGLVSIPSPIAPNRPLGESLEEAHEIAANLLVGLAGLHALVAIAHQLFARDGTLARMLPFGTVRS